MSENDWEHLAKIGSDEPGSPYGRNPDDFLIHYFHAGVTDTRNGNRDKELMQHTAYRAGVKHHLSGGGDIPDHEIVKRTKETEELMRILNAERARDAEKKQRTEGKSFDMFIDELIETHSGSEELDSLIDKWTISPNSIDTRSFAGSAVAKTFHNMASRKIHKDGFHPDEWPEVDGIEDVFHTQPGSFNSEGEHRSNIVVHHSSEDPFFWVRAQTHIRKVTGQTHEYNKNVSDPGLSVFTVRNRFR